MAAVRHVRASGRGTTQSAGTRAIGGEAAVPVHAEVVALDEDPLSGCELRARALLDGARQLHPGHEREDPRHAVPGPGDHGVLEVDGGPLHPDEDLAFGEVGIGQLDHRRSDDRPRLGKQIGRETHGLTVEGGAVVFWSLPLQRVRSDSDHDRRVWGVDLAAHGRRRGPSQGLTVGAVLRR